MSLTMPMMYFYSTNTEDCEHELNPIDQDVSTEYDSQPSNNKCIKKEFTMPGLPILYEYCTYESAYV